MLRGRFAPTPSGLLHLGNACTALLAWLHVRSAGGQFVLRIEDIDKARSRAELERQQLDDLTWLGLDWDEGPDIGGPCEPYRQSEREARYQEAIARLAQEGVLYPCYCSRAELQAIASAPHGLAAEGPVYNGRCRWLSKEERARKEQVKTPSLRFAMPESEVIFHDDIIGDVTFPAGAGGDFIVRRADGVFAYQLAVVVDDAAMGITHVLRGADLLDSTPRQLHLYETLGFPPPSFAHVPLLFGPNGERLSKRDSSLTLLSIRRTGTSPQTVIGLIAALCGLMEKPEPIGAHELISRFSLAKLPRTPLLLSPSHLKRLIGC